MMEKIAITFFVLGVGALVGVIGHIWVATSMAVASIIYLTLRYPVKGDFRKLSGGYATTTPMKHKIRSVLIVTISMYLGAGIFAGLMMGQAITALNPLGVAAVTLTWPNHIRCARVSSDCASIPEWAAPYIFTYK